MPIIHPAAFVILALCLATLATGGRAQTQAQPAASEMVFWYASDFPPVRFVSGPNKGQGSADKRTQILSKRMPEFRHQVVEAAQGRILEMLKTTPNACDSAILKTPERAAVIEFSAPALQILPNGLITTRRRLALLKPFLNERDELRFEDYLADGRYRVGIIAGRSFGSGIDVILKKKEGHPSIVTVPSKDQFESRLLKLINQNEFDAIIGYATELAYVSRKLGFDERDTVFVPVAEEPPLIPSYIACSKSEFGKRVIAAINRTLADPSVQREADAAYRAWLDKDSAARFDRLRKNNVEARP